MAATAKVGRRGQITLPKEVRERLSLQEGQRLAFVITEEGVTLQPMVETLRDMRGVVTVDGPQDFDAVRGEVRRRRALGRSNGE